MAGLPVLAHSCDVASQKQKQVLVKSHDLDGDDVFWRACIQSFIYSLALFLLYHSPCDLAVDDFVCSILVWETTNCMEFLTLVSIEWLILGQ